MREGLYLISAGNPPRIFLATLGSIMMSLAMGKFPILKWRKLRNLVCLLCIPCLYFKIQIFTGTTTYYELVFSDDANLPYWDPSKHVVLETTPPATEERGKKSCNTRKDKDKRQNRHTCGIFIGFVQVILGEPLLKILTSLGWAVSGSGQMWLPFDYLLCFCNMKVEKENHDWHINVPVKPEGNIILEFV